MVTPRDDRGQILLIAALTIAVTLIGVTVLLNASVIAEVRAPDDPATDLTEASRMSDDLESGLAGMAARLNRDGHYTTNESLNAALEANVSTYLDYATLSIGQHRATMLNASSPTDVQIGTYVADGNRSSTLALPDADVNVSERVADPAPIYGLSLNLSSGSLPGDTDAFGIELEGADGDCRLYRLEPNGSDQVDVVEYDIACGTEQNGGDGTTIETCDLAAGEQRFDFGRVAGTAEACHVNLFERVPAINGTDHRLAFHHPDAIEGGYRFVVGAVVDDTAYEESPDANPYVLPVVHAFDITLEQQARASRRTVSTTVTVHRHPETVYAMGVPWE